LPHPELYTYLPWGPYPTLPSLLDELVERRIRQDPGFILFAVIDKTRLANADDLTKTLAGVMGLLATSPTNLSTEIGFVVTFPPFQKTHVTTNAVGLLLNHTLDTPRDGGLGLRRVQWKANELNKVSVRVAEKFGFKFEGVLRWDRVLPEDKIGNGVDTSQREGEAKKGRPGRNTVLLSLCWDDWEMERENVQKLMERRG
jgi:RimJ/RimL family protein N-acetyltransferase